MADTPATGLWAGWMQRLLHQPLAAPWRASGQALLALALGLLLAALLPLDTLFDGRLDAQARRWAPEPPDDAALVVDIDEASLQRLGEWPLRRELYAVAGQWLQARGARALVVDLMLADARDGDAAWLGWLAEARLPVVLSARALPAMPPPPGAPGTAPAALPALPTPPGCRAADVAAWQLPAWLRDGGGQPGLSMRLLGAQSVPASRDGVLRVWPLWQRAGDLTLPVLPLAAWQALHPQQAAQLRCQQPDTGLTGLSNGTLRPEGAPLFGGLGVWPWLSPPQAQPRPLPLSQLLDAVAGRLPAAQVTELAGRVRGRVVVLGNSALTGDSVLTPAGSFSGAALVAASFDALNHGRLLAPPRPRLDALLLAVGLLPWAAGLFRRQPRPLAELGWLGAALAALLLVDEALVAGAGQFSHIGAPLAMLLAWAGLVLLSWRLRAHERHRALVLARAAAEASNQAKGEFVAHVSHEIRTPLNALLGAADLLAQTRLDDTQARYVGLFRDAGSELLQMLNDLLDLSKIEAGQLTIQKVPFSLTRVVASQVLLFEARAQQKGLQLQVEALADLPDVVVGDGARLGQILRNLLSNAVKFTSVGGVTLWVGRAADGGNRLRFEVRDTGIGVPEDRAEAIFAPFTQADSSVARRYGGTGLGLAICRRLAKAMGGRIGLNSRQGLGSTFFLELPLPRTSAEPAPDAESSTPGLRPGPRGTPGLPPMRMLLADDNPLNIVLAQAYLEGGHHHLDVVHDGAAALRRFEADSYPVVLMDLQMPVMGGLEAAREMRALEARRHRPRAVLVALTGQADPADAAQALAAGFDAHLGKPYSRSQLMEVLGRFAGAMLAAANAPTRPGALGEAHDLVDRAWPPSMGSDGPTTLPSGPISSPSSTPRISAISQLPGADLHEALDRLGGEQVYARVLDAAEDALLHFEERLRLALRRVPCDLEGAQRQAHDLKSVAATLGLRGLAHDARRLEKALAITVAPTEDPAVAAALKLVCTRLDALRDALAPGGPPSLPALPHDDPPG